MFIKRLAVFRNTLFCLVAGLSSLTVNAKDWSGLSSSEKLLDFLSTNVAGRKFKTNLIEGTTSDGAVKFEFERETVISGLAEYDHGVSFTVQNIVKQKNIRLSDAKAVNKDRVTILKCEIGERESTKALIGFCRTDVSGSTDTIGEVYSVVVEDLAPEKLIMDVDQVLYSDASPTGDEIKSVSSKSKYSFLVQDNRTTVTDSLKMYEGVASSSKSKKNMIEKFDITLAEIEQD